MMLAVSDQIWLAVIAGMPATIASLATLINSMRNSTRLRANSVKIDAIHESTNGMKDALVQATAVSSHAEGMAAQRAVDKTVDITSVAAAALAAHAKGMRDQKESCPTCGPAAKTGQPPETK